MAELDEIKMFNDDSPEKKWERKLLHMLIIPRTGKEYARRLHEKGCPDEIAAPLLARFEECGLIDDAMYANLYVAGHQDRGTRRLRDELRARGVKNTEIEKAFDENEIDETARALNLIRSYCGLNGMTYRKMQGRLLRRGFSGGNISDAFRQYCDELGYNPFDED